ncbi:MAG: Gfo/Idh/MocA family protein [bacterium]|jgi:predicted dehydrogenase
MNRSVNRRTFIKTTSIGASSLAFATRNHAVAANDEIVLGMIGTGGRGQRLLKAITNIPQYRVAALCDLREERVQQAAAICEQYKPAVTTYTDFRTMLEQEKLDACIVATEEGNHAKCAIPVLEAGLHCFSEKPVDTTVEKVQAVVKAATKARGIYQVGFQRRYVPSFQSCMKYIHEGQAGKVQFLQGMWQWMEGVGGRYLDLVESGGWFLAQACHHADVMSWVMQDQPPLRCSAMGAYLGSTTSLPEVHSEDHAALMFEFPGKVIFSYTHIMNCCEPFSGEKLWVYAEKGGLDLRLGLHYPLGTNPEPVQVGTGVTDWDEGTYEELEAFARHIQNHEQPLSNAHTASISTLIGIMGRKAMYNRRKNEFEPSVVTWEKLVQEG